MLYAPKDFKRWGSSAEAEPEGAVTVCESGGAVCWQPAARTTSKSGPSRANFLRMIDPPNSEIVTWGRCRLAQIDSVARFQRSMVSASKSIGDVAILSGQPRSGACCLANYAPERLTPRTKLA